MVFIFFFAQKPPPAPRSTSEVGGFALGDEKPAATQTLWFGQAFGLVCVAQTIARSSFLHLLAHVDPLLLTRLRKHQLHFKSLPGPRSLEVYIGGCLNGTEKLKDTKATLKFFWGFPTALYQARIDPRLHYGFIREYFSVFKTISYQEQ